MYIVLEKFFKIIRNFKSIETKFFLYYNKYGYF